MKKSNSQLLKEIKILRDDINLLVNLPNLHPLKDLIILKYRENIPEKEFKDMTLTLYKNSFKTLNNETTT